jgi:hypothetical protein
MKLTVRQAVHIWAARVQTMRTRVKYSVKSAVVEIGSKERHGDYRV